MNAATQRCVKTPVLVGMGETVLVREDEIARAIVGSCAGLVLYHRRCKLAAVAHVVLPEAAGRLGNPGKFADTAVPNMLSLLEKEGAHRGGLIAKLVGGAQMFGAAGPLQVGDANVRAVTDLLGKACIPIQAHCVGGSKGRKFSFCCNTGDMTIEVAGEAPFVL